MAYKLDQVTSYILALDEEEVNIIISALYDAGEDGLATEVYDECFGDDGCDCDEESHIGSLKINVDSSAATEARKELDKLTCAVDVLAEAYRGLNEAMKGPVEYSPDATDRMIKELLAGVRS